MSSAANLETGLAEALDAIEARIAQLEAIVFSPNSSQSSSASVSAQITAAHTALKKFADAHPTTADFWKFGKDFEQMLSVQYLDEISLPITAKEEIVFSGMGQLQTTAKQLEELDPLQQHVTAATTTDIGVLSKKLAPLQTVNASQLVSQSEQNERVAALLATYNDIMTSLSRKFVAWDDIITQAEKRAMQEDQYV